MLTLVSQNDKVMICVHIKDADAAQRVRKVLDPAYEAAGFEEAELVTENETVTVPLDVVTSAIKDIQV